MSETTLEFVGGERDIVTAAAEEALAQDGRAIPAESVEDAAGAVERAAGSLDLLRQVRSGATELTGSPGALYPVAFGVSRRIVGQMAEQAVIEPLPDRLTELAGRLPYWLTEGAALYDAALDREAVA